jgi:hypothetical protein
LLTQLARAHRSVAQDAGANPEEVVRVTLRRN